MLKGGLLLAAFDLRRATRDVGLLALRADNDPKAVERLVIEVASVEVEDGVVFLPDTITARAIRDGDVYPGVPALLEARLATARAEALESRPGKALRAAGSAPSQPSSSMHVKAAPKVRVELDHFRAAKSLSALSSAETLRTPFQLTIEDVSGALRVHSLRGKEALSRAWRFELIVSGAFSTDFERTGLGQRATVLIHFGDKLRAFYGVVWSVELEEIHSIDREIKYRIIVAPRLSLLKRRKRTRIFQAMRVPDIVSKVLQEFGIISRWVLLRSYPSREYCTQYEETDYDFVRRILAEAGIFFYFVGGGPAAAAAFAINAGASAVATVGSSIADAAGVGLAADAASAAALLAETLIPGDSVVGADDAASYPGVGLDDPAALAASTAAWIASGVAGDLASESGLAGAAIDAASTIASSAIASATSVEAPTMHFTANAGPALATYDRVLRFGLRNTVRSTGAAFRDYDPEKPHVLLQSSAVATDPFPPSPFESAAAAAAAAENAMTAVAALAPVSDVIGKVENAAQQVAQAAGQKVPFEVYEHHSPFLFPKWSSANHEAPLILRQKRRRASIANGESACHDFSPGHRFELQGHLAQHLDGPYVITEVSHYGQADGQSGHEHRIYFNTFECAPAAMPYPPKRIRRRCIQVMETATVVGPPGEEIHVDAMGRVKVQFHWDREGRYDGSSSCWIRTMQPWAGASWGHQFIPRVGMEVVVTFEGGDPDKPLVAGSVYNVTHPSPFPLPAAKTRSGWKTQSSPGGRGYNELSFEDQAGAEEIALLAHRDLNELVGNDHTTGVAQNRRLRVGGNLEQHVSGSRTSVVRVNDATSVGADRTLTVEGSQQVAVIGSHSLTVGNADRRSPLELFAWGDLNMGGEGEIVLSAAHAVTLQCGDSSLRLSENEITIQSPKVTVSGDEVRAASKGPSLEMSDEVELRSKTIKILSSKGSLELDDNARLDGQQVLFNCKANPPAKNDGNDPATKLVPLSLKLMDEKLQPYVGKDYTIVAGGRKYEGKTGSDGFVDEQILASAKAARLILWLDEKPEGRRLVYAITIEEEIPDAATLRGAWMRLRNLGYHHVGEPQQFDDVMRDAVGDFQREQGLARTYELDEPTLAKLRELYGH